MDFTAKQAKGLVITGTAVSALLASAVQLSTGQMPSVKIGVGAVLAGAFMYSLSDISPALSGSLALLLLVGAVLTNGADVAKIITSATK